MVWRTFVMDTSVTSHLTDEHLKKIRDDLFIVKDAGWTAVLRFCYVFEDTPAHAPYGDADKHWILEHIKQLRPIFHEFEGIITTVQAGFIGNWGKLSFQGTCKLETGGTWKMKTGVMGLGNIEVGNWSKLSFQGTWKLENWENGITQHISVTQTTWIMNTIRHMGILPRSGKIARMFSPLCYTQFRNLSHHNDCFLSSDDDVGTYTNPAVERPYLHDDTKYLIMGGETCGLTKNHRHECPTALSEMQTFHWTFLNEYFFQPMYAVWKQQGCYEEIHRRLGYRLRITEATIPRTVQSGADMCVKLVFRNDGFAAPVKHMNVMLVLKAHTGHTYSIKLSSADVRLWLPGSVHTVTAAVHVPGSFHQGHYHTYLAISDPIVTDKADYYVLLANKNVPEFSTGLNNLHHTIVVSGHHSGGQTSSCSHLKSWSPPQHSRYSRVFTGKLND
ncbi:uncharacterized protein LOC121388327 [Gigantopelta aegis]|uniref:uncharacterized protein LOC121388327 n=1 Tax=Gigantopelta aegis TaxID=1735272 RepID=UPI001B88B23A|nr:uncharacterized protein LOC121388327 [Gigantopelta aegis]